MDGKYYPRIAKAKITRTVTEVAIVQLGRDGRIEDVLETIEVLDFDDAEVVDVRSVLSVHS